jgi:hypothetical protein
MAIKTPKFRTHTRARRWVLAAVAAVIVIAAIASITLIRLGPALRPRIIRALENRFDSDVELRDFHVSLFAPGASGGGLVLRHRQFGKASLIAVKHFTIEAGLLGLIRDPIHVRRVKLEGLEIHVPSHKDDGGGHASAPHRQSADFIVDEIDADGTLLEVIPSKPGKHPLRFDIKRLNLHSAGRNTAMTFKAVLKNPKPPGEIKSDGTFGPWQTDDPGQTPVGGKYTFHNADLSVFHGISGRLDSEGKYSGVLERIAVEGSTDVPAFTVETGGNPLDLKTQFKAVVDGTNGDTTLDPVNSEFLHSAVTARGGVIDQPGPLGKRVTLDVVMERGRIEDLLLLAVRSDPPALRGDIDFHAKFDLPPGKAAIPDRLILDGDFGIRAAHFTSRSIAAKIGTLSKDAKGDPEAATSVGTASNFSGHFALKNGVIRFSRLSFTVPGAAVLLAGTYGLRTEQLDFRGELRMKATLSEATSGIKSFFLKALDPFFKKKQAGAVVPIRITGTRTSPSFGLDVLRR